MSEFQVGSLVKTPSGDGIVGRVEPDGKLQVVLDNGCGIRPFGASACQILSINQYMKLRENPKYQSWYQRAKDRCKTFFRKR